NGRPVQYRGRPGPAGFARLRAAATRQCAAAPVPAPPPARAGLSDQSVDAPVPISPAADPQAAYRRQPSRGPGAGLEHSAVIPGRILRATRAPDGGVEPRGKPSAETVSPLRRPLAWMSLYGGMIREIAFTDFKLKYQGSVLGYLWSLAKPLMLFAILYFVFTTLST